MANNGRVGYISADAVVQQEPRDGRVGYISADAVVQQEPRDGRVGYISADAVIGQTRLLEVTKTPDDPVVDLGQDVGFTILVENIHPAITATAATLNDPLPAGTGVNWSISPAYAGPGTCSITGVPPNEVLTCAFGNMAPGATATIHVVSATG